MINPDVPLRLVETMDDIADFHEWMGRHHDWLGFDVETSGLDWWRDTLRLGQLGDQHAGWAFEWRRWSGAVVEALTRWQGPIVGSNIGFDAHNLEVDSGYELPWDRVHDTVSMGRLINSVGAAGLKQLATRHIDSKAAAGDKLLKEVKARNGWDWGTVPIHLPEYWAYGALDTVLAACLAEEFMPQLKEQDLLDVYDLERAVKPVSYRMERNGVMIDEEYCHAKSAQLKAEANEIQAWLKDNLDLSNVGSNKQLAGWLLGQGQELTERTKNGDWKMDKAVLSYLMASGVSEKVRLGAQGALLVRRKRKIVNTYLKNFLLLAQDGILHASLNTLQARTGRQSVSRPSLQNLIRGPEVRDAFVARPGRRLIMADFDQIEIRLLAHFCHDPNMIAAIASGNIHVATGQMIYQDPSFAKGDPRYVPVKNTSFSKIYGAGVAKFALTAGIPLEQAQHVYNRYDELYPGVPNFIGSVIATGRQRTQNYGSPFVRTPLGRLQMGEAGKEYVLVNYLIQGAAADVMKQATVRVAKAGLQDYMMLTIHDELVLDVPDEDVPDVIHTLETVMPDTENWAVPLTVGVDVYQRWGDKYRDEVVTDNSDVDTETDED